MQPILLATGINDCILVKKGDPIYYLLIGNTFARYSLRLLGTNFGIRVLYLYRLLLYLKLADIQQYTIGIFSLAGAIR